MKLKYDNKEMFQMQIMAQEQITGKKLKIKKRKKAFHYPRNIERVYRNFIIENIVDPFVQYIEKIIKPELNNIVSKYDTSEFISENLFGILPQAGDYDLLISGLQEIDTIIFENNKDKLRNRIFELGRELWNDNTEDFKDYIQSITGIIPITDLTDSIIDLFVSSNTTLIRGLSQDLIKQTNNIITTGIQQGKSVSVLAGELSQMSEKFKGYRSELIARDQVSKFWGDLTERRQEAIGIEKYIWRTSQDERVRESHDALENMMCRWDDPTLYSDDKGKTWESKSGIGGENLHPGQAVNCRCYAEPVLDDILEE